MTTMLEQQVDGPHAWRAGSVTQSCWRLTLSEDWLCEFGRLLDEFNEHPLPVLLRQPHAHSMPRSLSLIEDLRLRLHKGVGLAVISGLPIDVCGDDNAIAFYWLLGQALARPVATKFDGTMLYEVADTGRPLGNGVRGTETNLELTFHSDNAFGTIPPDYVGLLCVRPATQGGISRFASMYSVHNELLHRRPDLLERLYQPMYFDRQGAHLPGAAKTIFEPMFVFDSGELRVRVAPMLVKRGYLIERQTMDDRLKEALLLLDQVLQNEDMWIEYSLNRGDLQFLNNRWAVHYRSAFSDAAESPRRMIRTWYRNSGRPSYNG